MLIYAYPLSEFPTACGKRVHHLLAGGGGRGGGGHF